MKYVSHDEDANRTFIRRLRGDDFSVNDNRLLFEIVNLIDNSLVDRVSRDVIIYEFNRVLPDSLLRAATAEYYCSKCNDLMVTKKELRTHLHLMHREDVEDAAPADNIVDDEENNYVKILRNARTKRKIYTMFGDRQQALHFQKSHRVQMTFTSEEFGVAHFDLTD